MVFFSEQFKGLVHPYHLVIYFRLIMLLYLSQCICHAVGMEVSLNLVSNHLSDSLYIKSFLMNVRNWAIRATCMSYWSDANHFVTSMLTCLLSIPEQQIPYLTNSEKKSHINVVCWFEKQIKIRNIS